MTASYEQFLPGQRLGKSVSVSPDGTMVAYTSDATGQFNLRVQPAGGGQARQLTSFTDRAVREVAWAPDGMRVAFTADAAGDEDYQVYLIPAGGGTPVQVPAGTGQHFLAEKEPFGAADRYLLYSGPGPDPDTPYVYTHDLATGEDAAHAGPPLTSAFGIAVSPDGTRVLAGAIASNSKCQCYLAPAGVPGAALEPVTAGLAGEYYYPGPWAGDSDRFYVLTTDGDHDHVSLGIFTVAGRTLAIADDPPWDVEDVVVSGDGRTVVWSVNQDGYSVLRARRDGTDLPLPPAPAGALRAMSISAGGDVLALLLETPHTPRSVVILHPGTAEPARQLTGITPAAFTGSGTPVTPELIRYPAQDGTPVPAWLYRPAGSGPYPVLLSVHGGPEYQARPVYEPLHQCLLARGIAVLAPNIRGSSGYGHAWQTRIYRDWGGIDLDDLAAAHAWLASQLWADRGNVAVYGASYGGFAALSCLARLPGLWAAGVSVCGPSSLESLARAAPPDWDATVKANFGDLASVSDVADMRRRSPLSHAAKIRAPLLVLQGANDPRVPQAESDQIIAAARANGGDVRYEVFPDEGHGFTSRANDIKAHQVIVDFLAGHLLP